MAGKVCSLGSVARGEGSKEGRGPSSKDGKFKLLEAERVVDRLVGRAVTCNVLSVGSCGAAHYATRCSTWDTV